MAQIKVEEENVKTLKNGTLVKYIDGYNDTHYCIVCFTYDDGTFNVVNLFNGKIYTKIKSSNLFLIHGIIHLSNNDTL